MFVLVRTGYANACPDRWFLAGDETVARADGPTVGATISVRPPAGIGACGALYRHEKYAAASEKFPRGGLIRRHVESVTTHSARVYLEPRLKLLKTVRKPGTAP